MQPLSSTWASDEGGAKAASFPEVREVALTSNCRSTGTIVRASREVVNGRYRDAALAPVRERGTSSEAERVVMARLPTLDDEAAFNRSERILQSAQRDRDLPIPLEQVFYFRSHWIARSSGSDQQMIGAVQRDNGRFFQQVKPGAGPDIVFRTLYQIPVRLTRVAVGISHLLSQELG